MGALAYEARDTAPEQPRLFAVADRVAASSPGAGASAAAGAGASGMLAPVVDASIAQAALAASAAVARGGRFAPGQARLRAVAAPAPAPVRTVDAVVTELFGDLPSRRQSTCVMCGGVVRPRPVAAGSVGAGRCSDCGTHFG